MSDFTRLASLLGRAKPASTVARTPKAATTFVTKPRGAHSAPQPVRAVAASSWSSIEHLLRDARAADQAATAARAEAAQAAALDAIINDAIATVEGKPRSAAATKMDPVLADAIALVNSNRR
jgi:hypothetical protein